MSGTYGRAVADAIVENYGNTLILRCSASERGGTSEFASKLIGQHQVVHVTRSQMKRATEWLPVTTTSEHLSIEPAIMASEIERLPDLEGFLKMASIPDWRRETHSRELPCRDAHPPRQPARRASRVRGCGLVLEGESNPLAAQMN